MDTASFTNEGAMAQALLFKTTLVLGKVRLFKSTFIPGIASLLDDFIAAEADYTGYVAGGIIGVALAGPVVSANGGALLIENGPTFITAAPFTVSNSIGGYWIEDNGPSVLCWVKFLTPVQMSGLGNYVDVNCAIPVFNG